MATLYSNQKTKWSQNVPSEKIDTNEQGGRMRIAFADVTLASAAIADVVQMVNLPNGARIIDGYLTNAALGSSTTLSVGNAAYKNAAGTPVALAAASYLAATSTSSAARTDAFATIALGAGSVVDANEDGLPITITLAGGTASGVVQVAVRYVVD
jgi:aspartate 1-decarboxylase